MRTQPLKELEILRQAQDDKIRRVADDRSTAGKVFVGQDQTFNARLTSERLHDLGDIGQGHMAVKEMIGLDENADAARALIETTRFAGPGAEPGQPTRL